jgi:hypothetical protein
MAVFVAVEPRVVSRESRSRAVCPAVLRAMTIWPRLDRRELARRGCDHARLAKYISRRTRMPLRSIEILLERS